MWETATGKRQWQAKQHEKAVGSLTFAPDDQTLISAGNTDGQVLWWNAATGQVNRRLARDSSEPTHKRGQLVLGPSGLTAFCGGPENGWRELEFASANTRRVFKNLALPQVFSPDGNYVLDYSNGCFRLIDLIAGETRRSFAVIDGEGAYKDWPAMVQFSPDGRTIAAVAGKEVVRVWDRDTGTVLATFPGHDGDAFAVAFSPDGQTIATSSGDGTILFWKTPPSPPTVAKYEPPPAPKINQGRKDTEGELIPDLARARLGLLRFQASQPISNLRFSKDGNSILAQTTTPPNGGESWDDVVLWNAHTGKLQNQNAGCLGLQRPWCPDWGSGAFRLLDCLR